MADVSNEPVRTRGTGHEIYKTSTEVSPPHSSGGGETHVDQTSYDETGKGTSDHGHYTDPNMISMGEQTAAMRNDK